MWKLVIRFIVSKSLQDEKPQHGLEIISRLTVIRRQDNLYLSGCLSVCLICRIYIAPLKGNYSEALPTQNRIRDIKILLSLRGRAILWICGRRIATGPVLGGGGGNSPRRLQHMVMIDGDGKAESSVLKFVFQCHLSLVADLWVLCGTRCSGCNSLLAWWCRGEELMMMPLIPSSWTLSVCRCIKIKYSFIHSENLYGAPPASAITYSEALPAQLWR